MNTSPFINRVICRRLSIVFGVALKCGQTQNAAFVLKPFCFGDSADMLICDYMRNDNFVVTSSTFLFSSFMCALRMANHNCINYINDHAGKRTVTISSWFLARPSFSQACARAPAKVQLSSFIAASTVMFDKCDCSNYREKCLRVANK